MKRLMPSLLPMLIVPLVACGGSGGPSSPSPTTTSAEIGTYALASLNGRPLPTTISEGSTQVEVLSGTLTLGAGNGLRVSTTFRSSGGAPVTQDVSGTYRLQGSSLTFSYTNGGANTATLTGDTLQMTNEGVVWLYRRA
jgi:hypothetical protein